MKTLRTCAVAMAVFGVGALAPSGGLPANGASAAPSLPAGGVAYVAGSTRKLCQVTGEMDRSFRPPKPTVNQTATRYGLVAADLGYSFEHDGKAFFLFGDAAPTRTFHGERNGDGVSPRLLQDNDAIGFTSDTKLGDCVTLDFIHYPSGAYKNPVVLNADGTPAITLGTNEMPISGISQGGKMYVIFGTDNFASNPGGRPGKPDGGPTRTVVGVSSDDANTWHYLYDFSKGPDAKFIYTTIAHGVDDGNLYIWGTQGGAHYRMSASYVARMPADDIGNQNGAHSLVYFTGMGPDGTPRFSASEADASPLFEDDVDGQPHNCMANFSVEWNQFVHRWVMLYSCTNRTPVTPGGIWMRVAEQPWGPWSAPQTIFNAERDGGVCQTGHPGNAFIHRKVTPALPKCDDLSAQSRLEEDGGNYAPYLISRFTTGDESRATSTLSFTMATWNPYTQVIMTTEIQGAH